MKVSFKLNGENVTVDVKPNEILLDTLRLRLGIKSVKRGCERGECGACTVLMDGKPVYSCMVLTPQAEGAEIETLEYLQERDEVKVLIESFVKHGAIQCGYCTPGFIITAYALIKTRQNNLTNENILKGLEGNLCRCTGYKKILEAIVNALNQLKTNFKA